MDLRCELSPLVFAEFYSRLDDNSAWADRLEERLAEVGWEPSWLAEAAERYETTWIASKSLVESMDDLVPLDAGHAVLASWLLAPLRDSGHCHDFGEELRRAVLKRILDDYALDLVSLPSQFKPVIAGWTMGMVVGSIDQTLPVAPAMLPRDENVRAAYEGLVEHIDHLGAVPTPWPEILGTATFWRGTGIAEGLVPESAGGQDAIKHMLLELRRALPEHVCKQLAQHFSRFGERRNTLTHIATVAHRPSFVEVKDEARDWPKVRLTIMGITQFVLSSISLDLVETASRVVREDTWDNLLWELRAYDL